MVPGHGVSATGSPRVDVAVDASMDGDVIEVKRGRPGLHGLQVLDGLQLRSRRLLVELEQQRRDDDRDRAQGHRG